MELVMKKLGLEIPPFTVSRRVCIEFFQTKLIVSAVDFDGTPVSLFPGVKVCGTRLEKEPFTYELNGKTHVDIELFFFGHYNEPMLPLNAVPCSQLGKYYVDIRYSPLTGKWIVDSDQATKKWITIPNRPVRPLKTNIPQNPIKKDENAGFSVEPKINCPHVGGIAVGSTEFIKPAWETNTCKSCGDKAENWVCLMCGDTFCSRFVKGHMAAHNTASGHLIAMSFSDLSVWCYACDDYITDPYINRGPLSALHQLKFGQPYRR
jgi:hypothetical protein